MREVQSLEVSLCVIKMEIKIGLPSRNCYLNKMIQGSLAD